MARKQDFVILYCKWKFEVEAPPNGREIVLRKSRFSMGLNYGLIFRRLRTKVHQIMSADAWEIIVCKIATAFSDCRYLVPFRRYSRSKCEVVRNRAPKACFSATIFWGEDSKILDLVFKIAPFPIMWQGFAAIGRETAEISRWIEKEKKAKHKGRVALRYRNGRPLC